MIVLFQNRTAALARGQKIGMKLKSYNNQKNLTTATEKKKNSCEEKIIQQSSPFLIP
jgi:hypothetical protein